MLIITYFAFLQSLYFYINILLLLLLLGMSESIGHLQTLFLKGGTEATRKSLEKAQNLTCNPKENTVMNNRIVVKEMCSKMNLSATIHVS